MISNYWFSPGEEENVPEDHVGFLRDENQQGEEASFNKLLL